MNLCRKKDFALVVAAALSHAALYQPVVAQQAPMALEWERNDRPDFRSDGLNYAHNGTAWTTTPTPLPVDDFGSGKDWFYALTKIYAPPTTPGGPLGAHIAYVAVGYVGWANWSGLQNGCNAATPPAADFEFPYHMGTGANAPGKLRMGMAYYDLDGTLIWYKAYYSDVLNGVIQDSEGNIVACGIGYNNDPTVFAGLDPTKRLTVNPTANGSLGEFTTEGCLSGSGTNGVMFVMKTDLEGEVIWNHYYSPATTLDAARTRSWGFDLVETKKNGQLGYRVVGFGMYMDEAQPANNRRRPYMVQLSGAGEKLWDHLDLAQGTAWDAASTQWLTYGAIDKTMDPTTNEDLFVISGWAPAGTRTAFAQFYREPSTSATYIPSVWTRNVQSEPAASYPGIDALQGKICTDVIFNTSGGAPTVVWPVIANQEAYKAEGFIFLLDPANGGQTVSTATIGEIHAYDLQIGLVSMANGNIGLCSTKWPSGKSFTSERYRWNDLSTPTRDCLEALRLENAPTISNYWAIINGVGVGNLFDYYGSQSYVAELNGSDLSLVWEKQWQHKLKTNGSDDCYPGNARRRQCNFKIVEAEDGGLVVCGNTGHNFDDAYIAKLAPCEDVFAYTTTLSLDANGEHHITTNTEWTDDMNIAGSIVVDPGKTLTVNTATIGFAASTQQLRTNIVVQPGGTLVVKNNGHLTSAPECTGQGMWDGVKVLGNGTTTGAGIALLESGAKFSNALTAIRCAEGSPLDPLQGNTSTGGIVQATDATFENNFFDIATRPHTIVDPTAWGPSSFTNCRFARTRALNNPHLAPGERVSLIGSANTEFIGCTFSNTSTVADPIFRGGAIHAVNTGVRVDEDSDDNDRSQFRGFAMAVLHSAFEPTKPAHINAADFTGNLRGAFVAGTPNAIVTNNTFEVADEPLNDLDIEGAYGAYLHGCTGFEFEENTFTASGTDHPKVGAIFKNTGVEDNMFYNNTFNGFADASDRSVGSLVMGTNADEEGDLTGLRIKCNDYSAASTNDHDVAFTGDAVLIAESQGSIGVGTTDPAGNTFANVDQLTCNGNDAQHFYVENAINTFTYWHHQPQQNVELVPHCASEPIDPDGWYQNSAWQYNKPQSCPNDVSGLVDIEDDATTASSADAEFEVLKEVYDNWRDGGDTEGLVDYVKDPQNSSYDVRNRLMNVAPKASKEAWIAAFEREPTMNAWHITQALLANSPLEPSVLSLMARSDLAPFYQDLVRNGQNGGVSIHSIYKSELAHFYAEKSTALQAMLRKSVLSADPAVRALAAQALDDHTTRNADAAKLALHYVANDLNAARTLVNTNLLANGKDKDYWVVQDLLVSMKSAGQQPHQLGAGGISTLQGIAANDGIGAAEAQAWLELLGMPTKEKVILPSTNKALLRRTSAHSSPNATSSILSAYPNPSNGPVYLVYDVPEGVTQVQVLVHDATGRLAFGEVVGTKGRVLELPQHALASGLHIATLLFDGIQVGTTKVEIVR